MPVRSKTGTACIEHKAGPPKKTRQGSGLRTHLGATSRNGRKKRYRGQGR
jgi:hypothetical protein